MTSSYWVNKIIKEKKLKEKKPPNTMDKTFETQEEEEEKNKNFGGRKKK